MKSRVFFLDNLRTFLIFLVVVLHAGIVYEPILEGYWIVSDPAKNNSIGLIRMYLDLFVMFTIFFISGYFVRYSVRTKSTVTFVITRIKRLMIPWLIAVLTLIPAYKAIFLFSRGLPQEPWYTYFHIYARAGADWGSFANYPTQSWLWFLPVLFLFQMIYLALYRSNLLRFKVSLKMGVILVFAVGVAYSYTITQLGWMGWYHSALLHFQNERLVVYLAAFLLGALCNKLGVFDSGRLNKRWVIYTNVVLTISLGIFTATALNLFFNMIDPGRNYYFISPVVDRIAYFSSSMLSMLSFLHVLLYTFKKSFNRINPLMAELNRNSYAVYIIHMVVMGLIALPMLQLQIPAFVKFILLTLLTFSVSNTLIYVFREIFQVNTMVKLAVFSGLVVVLVSAGYAGKKQEKPDAQKPQTEVSAPEMNLHEAAIRGDLNVVKLHIAAGSDLNAKEPAGGSSPLITAALFGKTEIAAALIDAGAEVNLVNNEGSTALHTAVFFCRKDIVELLLDAGADKSIRNKAGSTALESVQAPWEVVTGIYDYFAKILGPMGLVIDKEEIKSMRPEIAGLMKQYEKVK